MGTGGLDIVDIAVDDADSGVHTPFSITDLSREFGVTPRTLRFYEDEGLIHPTRRGTTRL